jgi:diadenosine tetraphosphate (Ap4A) HIT family hydrolase
MPETPEDFVARAQGNLRMPALDEWGTWPFEGDVTPRELEPPVDAERPRHGEGGVGCWRCEHPDEDAIWANENWTVRPTQAPTGLPIVLFLETRKHVDFPELDDDLQSELGPLLVKVQRAVFAIPDIANVHVCRWGDGSEHCHVWFMARPARVQQLVGSFAAIWDDIVPPLPDDVWRANVEIVRSELNA